MARGRARYAMRDWDLRTQSVSEERSGGNLKKNYLAIGVEWNTTLRVTCVYKYKLCGVANYKT